MKKDLLKFVSQDYYFCPHIGRTPDKSELIISCRCALYGGKILLKVFGKGFGEEPFLRKVFPDKYI